MCSTNCNVIYRETDLSSASTQFVEIADTTECPTALCGDQTTRPANQLHKYLLCRKCGRNAPKLPQVYSITRGNEKDGSIVGSVPSEKHRSHDDSAPSDGYHYNGEGVPQIVRNGDAEGDIEGDDKYPSHTYFMDEDSTIAGDWHQNEDDSSTPDGNVHHSSDIDNSSPTGKNWKGENDSTPGSENQNDEDSVPSIRRRQDGVEMAREIHIRSKKWQYLDPFDYCIQSRCKGRRGAHFFVCLYKHCVKR